MKTFNKELKIETYVQISDPDKIMKKFFESDWQEYFYKLEDLDDFVNNLVHELHIHPEHKYEGEFKYFKQPEGFGTFDKPNAFDEKYVHKSDELGEIVVVFGDTTVDNEW